MIGKTVSHYRITESVSKGGMGVVYKAEDTRLKRTVALKFLAPELSRDPDAKQRFIREARAASALDHPNILTIHDIGETSDGQMFICMTYYAGESLKEKITRGPLEPREAVNVALRVARGLAKAHDKGIIHRDVTPANVFITEDSQVKLVDFGLAKLAGEAGLSRENEISGTIAYMSPEQVRGEEVDQRTDIWSLGTVLYEMLTGRPAFPGEYSEAAIYSILNADPEPVTAIRPAVPPELEGIARRAMSKRREDRYPHALDLLGDLKAAKRGMIAGATVPSSVSLERPPSPGNLPFPLTSFIGRAQAMSDVHRMIRESRLVTLTGAGGCGKTRLALEVSRKLLADFTDGVWLVELASFFDPSLVEQRVATSLGLKEEPNRTLGETLVEFLKGKELLLLLDNCEHLLEACVRLAAPLLSSCPDLRVLAVSREPLGMTGENVFHVTPLTTPPEERPIRLEKLRETESVMLFVERAAAVDPAFALDESNAPAVEQICRRLDGIPLALELAAARIKVLTVEEITKRLDDRFRLLTLGSKTAQAHHQTLRALIDWSYDHLPQNEQVLFGRLSSFVGSWTLLAAETVCSGEGIEDWEVLDVFSGLVNKSLVEVDTEGSSQTGEARYRMLETVREYARERLREREEEAAVSRRHRDFYRALAEEAEPHLSGADQMRWLSRLSADYDNLRAALDAYLSERSEVENGLRLAGALGRYWMVRGLMSEGGDFFRELLALPEARAGTAARAKALNWAGNLSYYQGDFLRTRALHEESLAIKRELGDRWGIGTSLNNLGNVAFSQGDYDQARSFHEESLAIKKELKDDRGIAASLLNLGNVAESQGDYARARAFHEGSLALMRQLEDRYGTGMCLGNLGRVVEKQGNHAEARLFLEESLAIQREIGDRLGISESLAGLGDLARAQGDSAEARIFQSESLTISKEMGNRPGIAASLESFAALAAAGEEPVLAVRLLGAATELREMIRAPLSPAEQDELEHSLAPARRALGRDSWVKGMAAGRGLTLEQAIALALGTSEV